MKRVFLLSPATLGGERARMLTSERARFDLAMRLRTREGAPLGEVMAFLSGLYFRGKLAYALEFARPPSGVPGVLVITPTRGLRPPDERVNVAQLRAAAEVDIGAGEARFLRPLLRDARRLARLGGPRFQAVLLGSIASDKYVDVLATALGDQLLFPAAFVGRGDMSRGGLLLRCVDAGVELDYVSLVGAVRHGPRPPRLPPRWVTRA